MGPKLWVCGIICLTGVLLPSDASAIGEGNETSTCDWPSVVYLRTRDNAICSGVYVGGRIVLTAAHCDDGNGLYYNYEELHNYTGLVPMLSGECESDSECPSVTIEGSPVAMKCDDPFFEHPSPVGSCYLEEEEELIYSNFAPEVIFGEAYHPHGAQQPFNSIPIQYCKVYDQIEGGMVFQPGDFAYCILAEEPDVEPVPLLMHCEVDEFLDGTYTLDVVAVGFGRAGNGSGEESGRKRWSAASTEMSTLVTSSDNEIDFAQFTTFVPGYPMEGDSGGPLFLQLPDGSWRVMGLNVVGGISGSAIPAWKFVEWMLTDDEVGRRDGRVDDPLGLQWNRSDTSYEARGGTLGPVVGRPRLPWDVCSR